MENLCTACTVVKKLIKVLGYLSTKVHLNAHEVPFHYFQLLFYTLQYVLIFNEESLAQGYTPSPKKTKVIFIEIIILH